MLGTPRQHDHHLTIFFVERSQDGRRPHARALEWRWPRRPCLLEALHQRLEINEPLLKG
jgi:hypothetical protein